MIIRGKASCSHHTPGLQCSHAVGCASFSHKGEGRGLFEPNPCTAAWNHLGSPVLAALQRSCREAAIRGVGSWEHSWHSSLPQAARSRPYPAAVPPACRSSTALSCSTASPVPAAWMCWCRVIHRAPRENCHTPTAAGCPGMAAVTLGLWFGIYCSSP